MTFRGGVRSLNTRLARLEQEVPEPQGPILYSVLFHDGTPVSPRPDDGIKVPALRPDIVYRIASWDEALFDVRAGVRRQHRRDGCP